jgi:hypothetical protein
VNGGVTVNNARIQTQQNYGTLWRPLERLWKQIEMESYSVRRPPIEVLDDFCVAIEHKRRVASDCVPRIGHSNIVWLTVALSRERRERAPDESLLPASRDRRLECSGVKTFEHARPLVRRSPAAAQCYTARRTRPPHRRRR